MFQRALYFLKKYDVTIDITTKRVYYLDVTNRVTTKMIGRS